MKKDTVRYAICVLLVLVIFAGFGVQLINWQLVQGAEIREKADSTNLTKIKIEPTRGEILDANGVDLAINITGYRVVFDALYMVSDQPGVSNSQLRNEVILRLVDLFNRQNVKWINVLPIKLDENGGYVFTDEEEDDKVSVSSLKSKIRLQDYATAEDCINRLCSADYYNCEDKTPAEKLVIASVRYNMTQSNFSSDTKYVFAEELTPEMVTIIEENRQQLPGVFCETVPVRKYVNGTVAPKIVGYIRSISEKEYEENKDSGKYTINSKYGKEGIERAFENILVGQPGEKTVETSPDGSLVDIKDVTAEPGNTVYLTIDARLQNVLSDSLKRNVEAAQKYNKEERHYNDIVAGAAVVLRVSDFAVLAAQDYPTYDLNRFLTDDSYIQQLNSNKAAPFYDRAIWAGYPIGSTMKPAVALAALQEGVIDTNTRIFCNGIYHRFEDSGYAPRCMGYHGSYNVFQAIQDSCNVFFLETGFLTGIDTLNQYQRRLGLGEDVGLEIYHGEDSVLAGRDEREAAGGVWLDGDTSAASIGQSDNALTMIQLATYCATIANNGTRLKTHIVDKITDYSRQNVIMKSEPEVVENLGVSDENLKIVQQAMRMVVTGGTAQYTLQDLDIAVAAKTGTAETAPGVKDDHTLFIGYAPYENPEIAVAVIIEHGKASQFSANVAKDVFNAYFHGTGMVDIPATGADGKPVASTASSEGDASSAGTSSAAQ